MIDRRSLVVGGGIAAIGTPSVLRAQTGQFARPAPLIPIETRADRMYRVTVCLRPFRAAGPRIELERIRGKNVVHHYGHGGSGWSLSWGSAQKAVPLALQTGAKDIAVIGAGCIGITTAITAQRMGANVTIYAKDRFPSVRSAYATGSWTPSSRIAFEEQAAPDFADWWEEVARASFAVHQSYLGVAGDPVEWTQRWFLSDNPPGQRRRPAPDGRPDFLDLEDCIDDLTPKMQNVAQEDSPFTIPYARRGAGMSFNVAQYSRMLEAEFERAGGRFVHAEFESTKDLRRIEEKTIINCTGYAARALFGDDSLTPVRGQIAWLLPQEGVHYGVYHDHLLVLARRDGIVVQALGEDDYFGFGETDETPDMAAALQSIEDAAAMFKAKAASRELE